MGCYCFWIIKLNLFKLHLDLPVWRHNPSTQSKTQLAAQGNYPSHIRMLHSHNPTQTHTPSLSPSLMQVPASVNRASPAQITTEDRLWTSSSETTRALMWYSSYWGWPDEIWITKMTANPFSVVSTCNMFWCCVNRNQWS